MEMERKIDKQTFLSFFQEHGCLSLRKIKYISKIILWVIFLLAFNTYMTCELLLPSPSLLLNLETLDLPSHLSLQVFIPEFLRKKVNLMACCFAVVVLKSRNQTVKAAEADVWAGRAESLFERLLLQADIIFSLNSVAVSSTVPLNYGNIYDFLSTLKLKLVLPFFESISKIMEYITEQLSISELVQCWFAAPTYGMFILLRRFLLGETDCPITKQDSTKLKFKIRFKKLYSCLQFGMRSRLHFKFIENWLRCL